MNRKILVGMAVTNASRFSVIVHACDILVFKCSSWRESLENGKVIGIPSSHSTFGYSTERDFIKFTIHSELDVLGRSTLYTKATLSR